VALKTQFEAATKEYERTRPPVSQLFFGTPLYENIPVDEDIGDPIQERIKFIENTGGGHAPVDGDLSKPQILQKYTIAEWDYKLAEVPWALPRKDISVNKGDKQIFDILMQERKDAEASLIEEKMNLALFGEDPANPGQPDPNPDVPQGLLHLVDNDVTAGVAAYGKIAVADASNWSVVRDTTAQQMSDVLLEEKYHATAWASREPDFGVTTNALFTKLTTNFLPRQRGDFGGMVAGGVKTQNKKGYFIPFNNMLLYKDNQCPASHVFILQTKGPIDPHTDKKNVPYLYIRGLKGEFLVGRDYPEQETSERLAWRVLAYYALVCVQRRFQHVLTNVS